MSVGVGNVEAEAKNSLSRRESIAQLVECERVKVTRGIMN